jgi:CHAT domain-containing protein
LKSVSANQKSKNNNNSLISTDLNDYFDGLNLLEALNGASKSLILLYTIDSSIVNIENSLFYLKLCDTLISDLRKKQLSDEDKIRLNSEISNIFDNAVEISYLLYDKYKKQEYLNEIFYFIERNKASTLLQSIAEAKAEKFSDIPDSLIILEQKIKQNINIYNQKITEATTLEEEYFYRDKLVGENKKMHKLIDTYKTNYTSFYNAKFNVTTTNIFQLQNLIDNNTAIINYYLTDKKIFTFIITKNEQLVLTTEYDNEFKKSIQKFNTVIQSNSNEDVKKYEKLGFSIYSKLFNFELPTAITKLIIVPNDILNTLSFEALLTEEYKGETKKFKEYPFFIKKYDVSYIYSATLLYETSKINYDNVTRTDIFLAAPVFKPDNPQEFSMHPISTIVGTETEVQNIGNIFNSKNLTNDILTNNLANENKLKNLFSTKQYKILHIATHGAVNIEQPELSALILSRDVNNIDDGILYTGEIYNIKIKSELVILSACETAIGKISEGEGVIGLSRAIMFAGSKNLIISLWKVADIATTELMTTFYKILLSEYTEINSNTTFSRSLHQAKLEMIEGKYNHPYFWSSFVLIGK